MEKKSLYLPRSNHHNECVNHLVDYNLKLSIFLNNQHSLLIYVVSSMVAMIRCHCHNFVEKMCQRHEQSIPFHFHWILMMKMIVDAYDRYCHFHPNRLDDASKSWMVTLSRQHFRLHDSLVFDSMVFLHENYFQMAVAMRLCHSFPI